MTALASPAFPVFESSDFSGKATAFYFDLVRLQDNPEIPRGFPHRHNYYHLLWMTEAAGTHMLDFESFEVRTNTVFFVSPGQLHSWTSSVRPKGYVINFSTDFFLRMFPRSDDIAQFPFFHIAGEDGEKESPESEMVSFARDRADTEEAKRLNLLAGERVIRIVNLQRLGAMPVAVDYMVLSHARFPDLTEKMLREREETNYSLYQTRYGINIVRAHERLRATLCDKDTARLLGLKPGAPVLEINRTALSYHNTPVELRRSLVNTAAHEYWNELGKPDPRP